jgi:IstB-like ATP binding protein
MFALVSSRYERASMIVTSNKPFSGWGKIFGDDAVATAMIRPAHPPRRHPQPQGRLLPPPRQGPRAPASTPTRPHLTERRRQFPTLAYLRLAPETAGTPTLEWPSLQPAKPAYFSTSILDTDGREVWLWCRKVGWACFCGGSGRAGWVLKGGA